MTELSKEILERLAMAKPIKPPRGKTLQEVADVWLALKEKFGRQPTRKEVAFVLGVSDEKAGIRVARAKKAGLIP